MPPLRCVISANIATCFCGDFYVRESYLGLEMGADDYLTKPYSLRDLLVRARAMLQHTYGDLSTSESGMLYAGDLLIDRRRGQVWRDSMQLTAPAPGH